MGQATNAVFFYGICWDEEDHLWPWEDTDDENADHPTTEEWLDAHGLLDDIDLGVHCSESCRMGYAAVRDTVVEAARGYPRQVTPSDGDRGPLNTYLIKFCEAAGYDFDELARAGKVGWWICSYWEI